MNGTRMTTATESARHPAIRHDEFGALDQRVERRSTTARKRAARPTLDVGARPEILLIDLDFLHADPQQPRKAFSSVGIAMSLPGNARTSRLSRRPSSPVP